MSGGDNVRQPPAFASDAQATAVADALRAAGYTQEGLAELVGFAGLAPPADRLADFRERAAAPTALAVHTRLWWLGDDVPLAAVRQQLPQLEAFARAGLLRVAGDTVQPQVAIAARQGLCVVADRPAEVHAGAPTDHVMGPAQSTVLVERIMADAPGGQVLDLGTGSGYLALRAAASADRVVATDLNARAVAMTRLNAQLNGIDRVEALAGDLYEPVGQRRFDRIVSSPPYVISPGSDLMFCESGWRGDLFCRELLRQAAAHLVDGGLCQMVCNWPHGEDQSWQEGIADWFDDIGCDALVFGGDSQSADEYASNWIRDTRARGDDVMAREHPRWLAYLKREGIERVSYGAVTLRRRDATGTCPNWVKYEPAPLQFGEGGGADIVRRLALFDFLEQASDSELLDAVIVVGPGLEMTVPEAPDANRTLRRAHGLVQEVSVDVNIAGLIERCTGTAPLRAVLEAIAGDLALPFERFAPMALATVRGLIAKGVLEPAD
ncbi:MAG: methyltransferase [Pseudomonadota bacterium]